MCMSSWRWRISRKSKVLCDAIVEFADKPIIDFMNKLKLNEKLINILLYVIGLVSSNQLTEEKKILTKDYVGRLSIYLRSIGQYGDTPMLVPEYSSSEFPQSFARTSCVLLSIYIVNTLFNINKVNVKDSSFESVEINVDSAPIVADKLLFGADYAKMVLPQLGYECKFKECFVLQMVCIVTRPIIGSSEVIVSVMGVEGAVYSGDSAVVPGLGEHGADKNIPEEDGGRQGNAMLLPALRLHALEQRGVREVKGSHGQTQNPYGETGSARSSPFKS
eukprot:TRINITY_DN6410_c0_g1_i18.p1 TRINITY_DN6410_c0_g1~~TRINITY_DN6410_c0_g1_i18.p1  ORF type:complete len:276 (-),score=38.08 TRINITY_DN6410_c0_g1_i18:948-1775(-)